MFSITLAVPILIVVGITVAVVKTGAGAASPLGDTPEAKTGKNNDP